MRHVTPDGKSAILPTRMTAAMRCLSKRRSPRPRVLRSLAPVLRSILGGLFSECGEHGGGTFGLKVDQVTAVILFPNALEHRSDSVPHTPFLPD